MEPTKIDHELKLPNMVMCGDHPSFTKTELNMKEIKVECKEKEKDRKTSSSFAGISPTSSRTKPSDLDRSRIKTSSDHAIRTLAKPRVSSEYIRPDLFTQGNKELVQAALCSARWPPCVACAWLLAAAAAHALHALQALLGAALPPLRNLCQYFRTWTERSWRAESGDTTWRVAPALLAAVTAVLYAACALLACVHALAQWALRPQYGDTDRECRDTQDTRVTDYLDTSDLQIDHAK